MSGIEHKAIHKSQLIYPYGWCQKYNGNHAPTLAGKAHVWGDARLEQ